MRSNWAPLSCCSAAELLHTCTSFWTGQERVNSGIFQICVLAITLQTFPFIQKQLSPALRKRTMVFADEVHRSHADKSLTEALEKSVGVGVRLRMFTGTATDRCLRLFGYCTRKAEAEVYKAFHAIFETECAKEGIVFEINDPELPLGSSTRH